MKGPTGVPAILKEYESIPIEEFDTFARGKLFAIGPVIDVFGNGYGDPYQPSRAVWGTLKDGRKVKSVKVYK